MISSMWGLLFEENENKYIRVDNIIFKFLSYKDFDYHLCERNHLSLTRLYTYLTFSEQIGFTLYGFETGTQKQFFLDLISVQGIGYSLALNIMSQVDYEDFKVYVFIEDKKELCKIKGIGVKGVEKIIKQLKKSYQ